MPPTPDRPLTTLGFRLSAAPPRGDWEGVAKVVRFNPAFFVGGVAALGLGAVALRALPFPRWLAALGWSGWVAGAAQFAASILATHAVYDRSALFRWTWLPRALGGVAPARALIAHSGFDEVSVPLRAVLPETAFRTLDLHDAAEMTEPSIARARRLYPPPPGTEAVPWRTWPVESGAVQAVFLLFAAHEWRTPAARVALLREARRVLAPGGRILLAEHLRDGANFAVYGPGALHFHSRRTWREDWTAAGLQAVDEIKLTPFVHVWPLTAV